MPGVELRGLPALEAWGRRVTSGYRGVQVHDLSSSWRDGLAFCAIIHHFRPDLVNFDSLSKENVLYNNQLAFKVGQQLGIPALLDAEDMLMCTEPDRSSVALYLSEVYQCFVGSKKRTPRSSCAMYQRTYSSESSESSAPSTPDTDHETPPPLPTCPPPPLHSQSRVNSVKF